MKAVLFDKTTVNIVPESTGVTGTWKNRTKNGLPIAYDSYLVRFVYNQIKDIPNPVLLDVGASTGSFALLGVAIPALWVTAFEPNPEARRILTQNVALNKLEKRVKILPWALWHKDGKALLKIPADPIKAGLACLGKPKRFVGGQRVKVVTRRLDSIVGLGRAHVVKIDAEGAEWYILQGGERYIKKHRPLLLLEYYAPNTMQFGYEPQRIRDLLKAWGYTCRKRGKEDLWAIPK